MLSELRLPLIGKGQPAGRYSVKLHFAELAATPGAQSRKFSVKLQGKTVLRDFNILKAAGRPQAVVVREFEDLSVSKDLTLQLIPNSKTDAPESLPLLNAIEVKRTDVQP